VRRQHPLGPYTVDFVILSKKLVIELDGPVRELFGANDEAREAWLKSEGYRVLRVANQTARNPDALFAAVRHLKREHPTP
jgi:very-short-patch-repair endonuclease